MNYVLQREQFISHSAQNDASPTAKQLWLWWAVLLDSYENWVYDWLLCWSCIWCIIRWFLSTKVSSSSTVYHKGCTVL